MGNLPPLPNCVVSRSTSLGTLVAAELLQRGQLISYSDTLFGIPLIQPS